MYDIPQKIKEITQKLEKHGFEAYLVGGCVRDLIIGKRNPKDWDITTNATPEKILKIYPHTHYENNFGTVAIILENEPEDSSYRIIEITPYRLEEKYSDARHPDSVTFTKNIKDDLGRRDFTMNALALSMSNKNTHKKGEIFDPFNGIIDIKNKIIETVGNPVDRFSEDALRMLRAIRFVAQLDFKITNKSKLGIEKNASLLEKISGERIREEFVKIIMSDRPEQSLNEARELGLLKYFIPELLNGVGCKQNKDHIYDVWTHLVKAIQNGATKKYSFEVRLAALFHDIGKPTTKRYDKIKKENTFYGHDVVGARITKKIMERLKFDKKTRINIEKLVRWHMFFTDVDAITLSAVRRLVKNVGKELIWKLMYVRRCDRIGMGRPKESPYRLRKYESMIEEAIRDPISVKQLKLNGDIMLAEMEIKPGPRIGWILHALLEEVLDDPKKNTYEYLKDRALNFNLLEDNKLRILGEQGKEKTAELNEEEIDSLRKKHGVQ